MLKQAKAEGIKRVRVHALLDGRDVPETSALIYVEFFPPLRSANQQKFNASSETGAWAHCNPRCPEETAAELREAYDRYKNNL